MRRNTIVFILVIATCCSCRQRSTSSNNTVAVEPKLADSTKHSNEHRALQEDLEKYIYTDTTYTSFAGKGITIQNSFPKGGGKIEGVQGYYDANGTHYGHGIFWTRILNETDTPVELTLNFPAEFFSFPADSLRITPSSGNYFKFFLPSDSITTGKLSSYNYGITGLKSFFDTNFDKATQLQKTIGPNEESIFYVALLVDAPDQGGPIRTQLILNQQELFYSISIEPLGTKLIPCGQLLLSQK